MAKHILSYTSIKDGQKFIEVEPGVEHDALTSKLRAASSGGKIASLDGDLLVPGAPIQTFEVVEVESPKAKDKPAPTPKSPAPTAS